jgi:hypothetical protein
MARRRQTSALAIGTLTLFSATLELAAQSDVLTLDDAVRLALDHNRSVEQAMLSAQGLEHAITAARTQRHRSSSSLPRPVFC